MQMNDRYKAAVLTNTKSLYVGSFERRELKSNEMRIHVLCCAICGSDIRIFNYGNPRVKLPHVIGHEVVGEVIELGEEAENCYYKVGDKVCFAADLPCSNDRCKYCEAGMINSCDENLAIGYQFDGGFAEEMILPDNCFKRGAIKVIDESLPDIDRFALTEPLACVMNGLSVITKNSLRNDNVLVFGGGPIGIMLGDMMKNMLHAKHVIIVEPNQNRRKIIMEKFPFIEVWNNLEGYKEKILETYGSVDVVFTANSNPTTHSDAIEMCSKNGIINLFGGLGTNDPVPINTNLIHYKQLHVTATHGSNKESFAKAFECIKDGVIDAKKYITSTYKLDDIAEAFESLKNPDNLKILIKP